MAQIRTVALAPWAAERAAVIPQRAGHGQRSRGGQEEEEDDAAGSTAVLTTRPRAIDQRMFSGGSADAGVVGGCASYL